METTNLATGAGRVPFGAASPLPGEQAAPSAIASAGVVHDLGNLIQIAASAISVVARSEDMAPSESGAILRRAKTCLEQAGALVRQTIGLIRGRALSVGVANVTACLADIAVLVEALHQTGLALDLDLDADLPAVRCDPLALRNAVLNLVFNARDAMAGEGTVAISGRAGQAGQAAGYVEIAVTDQGVGMSPATIDRAFDPFFTTKADGLGGVGLPMVEGFVREAGGEISIRSKLGAGTTVTLRLPAAIQEPPQKEPVR